MSEKLLSKVYDVCLKGIDILTRDVRLLRNTFFIFFNATFFKDPPPHTHTLMHTHTAGEKWTMQASGVCIFIYFLSSVGF